MSKLRWNCQQRNECFVIKKHVKLEVFDDCFEHGIQTCDIDGITEIGGHALIQEWKDPAVAVATDGQDIMFTNLTKINHIVAVVVYGDAETMIVDSIDVYQKGKSTGRKNCDLDELKRRIVEWAKRKYPLRTEIMKQRRREINDEF